MSDGRGTLWIVSVPIGNLGDVTDRAREVLSQVDLVACEDTRTTGRLLAHLGVRSPMVSLHEHNEARRLPELLERLGSGADVALVSDAGTPLLSDPGYPLVRAVLAEDLRVSVVPGASSLLAALVVSGLPPYPFTFCGFPPPKRGRRRRFYERFAELDHTLVVFESPHRIEASLEDAEALATRPLALCRELTKLHEEVLRGSLAAVREQVAARARLKGELVLVFGPPDSDVDTAGSRTQSQSSSSA